MCTVHRRHNTLLQPRLNQCVRATSSGPRQQGHAVSTPRARTPFKWGDTAAGRVLVSTLSLCVPAQDLLIPSYKNPTLIGWSPLLGFPALERTVLLSFQGNLGAGRLPHYSRGIRQRLHRLASRHSWRQQHNIVIAGHEGGDYAMLLSSSTFCLVVPGACVQHARGWPPLSSASKNDMEK